MKLLEKYPLTLEAQEVREAYPELVPGVEPSALDDFEGGGTE